MFSKKSHRVWEVTDEYLALAQVEQTNFSAIKAHLFRMWHACLPVYTDLRELLGKAHSVEEVLAVAAELKTRLTAAEAANDNPVEPREHHAASGTRPVPPIWILQPKVRDRKLAEELHKNPPPPGTRRKKGADGELLPEKPAKKAKASREERIAKLGYVMCACNENPMSKRCSFNSCKICCRKHTTAGKLDCPGHKIWNNPPAETQLQPAGDVGAATAAKGRDDGGASAGASTGDGDGGTGGSGGCGGAPA